MKKRITSLVCAILILTNFPLSAQAVSARASAYIASTSVRAYAVGYGKVLVEIDVGATHTMEEVGASNVFIYKQQNDGTYKVVYTYTKEAYPNLIVEDSFFGFVDVTYRGTAGCRYYALVGCYAKDSSGSETLYFTTNSVVAE